MPYYRLTVKDGTPTNLLDSSPHHGPVTVEASDENTARAIAKTNFWTILRDTDGFPKLDCLWADRDWVACNPISIDDVDNPSTYYASCDDVTCPDFRFDNGRYARLVEWPTDTAIPEPIQARRTLRSVLPK